MVAEIAMAGEFEVVVEADEFEIVVEAGETEVLVVDVLL